MLELARYRFDENVEVRHANRSVVESWFALDPSVPEDCRKMHNLFWQHGKKQVRFLPEGSREYIGKSLEIHHEELSQYFAEWTWDKVDIFSTQYPTVLWALSEGRGTIRHQGVSTPYENAFAHMFLFEGPQIRTLREWADPIPILKARGIAVPDIQD